MNENWPRWILASINQYFDTYKSTYDLKIELSNEDTSSWDFWCELFVRGPVIKQTTKNRYIYDYELVLVCNDITTEQDRYRLQRMVGFFSTLLESCIPIYCYGLSSEPENDESLIGSLNRRGDINTQNLGNEPGTRLMQSIISANYRVDLTGDA